MPGLLGGGWLVTRWVMVDSQSLLVLRLPCQVLIELVFFEKSVSKVLFGWIRRLAGSREQQRGED